MNSFELTKRIYSYLGFKGVQGDARTDRLILECLEELNTLKQFRYRYKLFGAIPEFLHKPPYADFLQGCSKVILCVTTLGTEVDKRIKYLGKTDIERSVVMDSCASALLEYLADEYEKELGDNLTYRFCPGYGGSQISDIKEIFNLVDPQKIGVILLESNLMLPQKSMAGIIGVGKAAKKTCKDCFMLPHCQYRKEGAVCYSSEKTL